MAKNIKLSKNFKRFLTDVKQGTYEDTIINLIKQNNQYTYNKYLEYLKTKNGIRK